MKSELQGKNVSRQVILGILVIGLGVLFLVDNLGFWDFRHALQFWPMAFIAVGVLKLVDSRRADGYFLGAVLVGVGVMMILNRLGIVYFSWRMVWPVLLIALGAAVLYRAVTGRRVPGMAMGMSTSDDSFDVFAILGGFERRITTPAFCGGEATAIMGGCSLDMRNSAIDPVSGEAVVNVFAVWGGVTLKVPPDWTVILQGTPIMGGFVEKTVQPPDASKRLIVRGYVIMGGLEVRN
jgi:predicted membrane protein